MQADVLRVPVGPGAMHVERFGHGGTAVILIHGFGTSSFLWRNVAPAISDAGHTAYAIDMFGHGESDRPIDSDFGIAAQAEYLDAAMTALRVARGIIVGIDIGGAVALRLAATRPERVEKLVLINTPVFDEIPSRDITQMQRSTAKFAFRTTRGVLGAAPLIEGVLRGSVADPDAKMPVKLIARYLAPFAGRDGVNHLLAIASSINADDLEDVDIKTIHVPALVVWGEEDQWVDSKMADRLVNALPDGRLVRIPGIGRLVPEENPEQMSTLLLDFMRRRAVA
ncbi:MAG TPA: alpha/beta hydrolase [Gemmatimonadaceae bacterium]|jgi:pimeloyl-ACP methyl ester carboxylesterase|nr:alpha/beta hydrolase [Gemmatimonadaceae bacterium]